MSFEETNATGASKATGGTEDMDAPKKGWSRRAKHVALRFALLVAAYLAWGALALALVRLHAYSSQSESLVNGHVASVTQQSSTVYQENPGPVRVILAILGGALLIATVSVLWRVARSSERLGITGMVAAAIAGVVALLGMLTIGPFILPLTALLVLLGLPIAPAKRLLPPPRGFVPAGWYGDPDNSVLWRYWDGRAWTEHSAPMIMPR